MFRFYVLLLVIIFILRNILADNDDNESSPEKQIVFNRTDRNGLMWPLPNWNDASILLIHAIHCVRKVQSYDVEDFSEMNLMHGNHCAEITKQYISFFNNMQTYSIQALLCKDTRKLTRVKRFAPGAYTYPFRYFKAELRKRRDVYQDQNDYFTLETGNNLAKLLMKKWQNPMNLTQTETDYLNELNHPEAVRIGALSIYCNFGENVDTILNTLSQYLAEYHSKRTAQRLSANDNSD
jgi:hypothetical protein